MMQSEVREISSLGEWLEWRRSDFTASDISVLFKCNPYGKTLRKLIAEKEGTLRLESYAMQRGRAREHRVADAIQERHPEWRVEKANSYHRLPDHRLGATPDYWLNDDGLIECKRVGAKRWIGYGEKPPLAFTLQTLTELLVTGRERGVLAITIGEPATELRLYEVPRHAAAEQRILDAVAEFWRDYQPPPLAEALKRSLELCDAVE